MAKAEIYALLCPITGDVRYIGKANNSQKRLLSHIRDSRVRDTPVYRWFRKLAKNNLLPELRVLCITENWREAERNIISEYRQAGARLLNVADGGDEPYCSKEQRAKNGRSTAYAIHSDPKKRRVWELKRSMGQLLKYFKSQGDKDAYNKTVAKLHVVALKAPRTFGSYHNLTFMA